jgi:vancomycin resistance protein YoaR
MSAETPIAAFSSFFAYNNGVELNDGRVKNIVRSCELMTRVMQPGESLDFNEQIGPYKIDNGYFLAPVLINGEAVPGYGGGTCQSSSTLYNTVRQLPGITIVYRRPHGPACARYLPMHQDAAVGSDKLNFIFRNDYEFPIRILAESTGEGVLTIQIFKAE